MWLCINSLWHTENTWPMFYLTTHLAVWDRQILCYWWVKIFTIILKLCVFSYSDQKTKESWTLQGKGNCFMLKFARCVSPNWNPKSISASNLSNPGKTGKSYYTHTLCAMKVEYCVSTNIKSFRLSQQGFGGTLVQNIHWTTRKR